MRKILASLFILFICKSVGCYGAGAPQVDSVTTDEDLIQHSVNEKPMSLKEFSDIVSNHADYYGRRLALTHFQKNIPRSADGAVTVNIGGSSRYCQSIWYQYDFNTKRGEFQEKESYNKQLHGVLEKIQSEIIHYNAVFAESNPVGKTFTVTVDKIFVGKYSIDEKIFSSIDLHLYYPPDSTILFSKSLGPQERSCGSYAECAKELPPNNTIEKDVMGRRYVKTNAFLANGSLVEQTLASARRRDNQGYYLHLYAGKFPASVELAKKLRQDISKVSATVTFKVLSYTSNWGSHGAYSGSPCFWQTPSVVVSPVAITLN